MYIRINLILKGNEEKSTYDRLLQRTPVAEKEKVVS